MRYKVSIVSGKKKIEIEDRSNSFLRQFGAIIGSLFGHSSTVRNTLGQSVIIPGLSTSVDSSCRAFTSLAILASNNPNDRFLTFEDFNISMVSPTTRVQGFPTNTITYFADRMEITIQDAYLYSGADSVLYAIGLRCNIYWVGSDRGAHLIAKDIFDPPLELPSNSRIDLSYKIVVSV